MRSSRKLLLFTLLAVTLIIVLPACEKKTGMIGDYVWFDKDEDGIQDPDEKGVDGVMVRLFSLDGVPTKVTTTDADGMYNFQGMESGRYYIAFLLPPGYKFTWQQEGDDATVDSDADPVTGFTPNFEYKAGTIHWDYDAGLKMELVAEEPTPEPTPKEVSWAIPSFYEYVDLPFAIRQAIDAGLIDDAVRDYIYSQSIQNIINPRPATDILKFGGFMTEFDPLNPHSLFQPKMIDCDKEEGEQEDETGLICPKGAADLVPGKVWFLVMKLDAPVPMKDETTHYTYSVVVDKDGEPGNNFQAQSPFDWDYYQNTDRWYELTWNPAMGAWGINISDIASGIYNTAESNARALIVGDVIVFMIPGEEIMTTDGIFIRFTAFGDDGTFSVENSSGDVDGADPTEPMKNYKEVDFFIAW